MKSWRFWQAATLIFASGFCALAYQVVWLRELRLIFGSSTAATGMVLAVFMGGLGTGAFYLGRLADRVKNPLALYGGLELGISVGAGLSTLLLFLVNKLYLALGGALTMGLPLATLARVLFSALILLAPTVMMGGTLPALARAVETAGDRGRRDLALLYGLNTIGGVLGVVLATFFFLERLGNQATLWLACLLNLLVGAAALLLARRSEGCMEPEGGGSAIEGGVGGGITSAQQFAIPRAAIHGAAFIVGFAFLLMELVWYRMLTPLLGGSTFTFGLILAVALTGIGIGGALCGLRRREVRPSLGAFTLTCGLQALFIAIPYALGDGLATFTSLLKPMVTLGFTGQLAGWAIVTVLVVLPAAVMAGIQFPMLIGLLGQGRVEVGCHTGSVYAWNTAGAIAGSLAGGFGLIPLLSAPGCWVAVVILLVLLCLGAMVLLAMGERHYRRLLAPGAIVLLALLLVRAEGPSMVWRHSAIGVTEYVDLSGANQLKVWQNGINRQLVWEQEGIESSVALLATDGLAFVVNGKPDGHALGDAGTQVMGPLIGALLHPAPRRGLVIGLGTGSSAGWLAEVPTMDEVDVVEIEPAILEVARRCAPVNFNVLRHPKVRVIMGDGREVVQTTDKKYDLIFSEPSNPYRAGIASLYTKEFYQAASDRLAPGGYFSQWVQSYHVDAQTIRTISATLASVFNSVEIWFTDGGDLLFLCAMEERGYALPLLRQKVATEPFRSALQRAWGVSGGEGFLAGYLGRAEVSRRIAEEEKTAGRLNTDDRMLIEFGFARTAGRPGLFSTENLRLGLRNLKAHRPSIQGGIVDWALVDENYFRINLWVGSEVREEYGYSREQVGREEIYKAYISGDFQAPLVAWQSGRLAESNLLELAMAAESLAEQGDSRAATMAARVGEIWPASGDGIMARYLLRKGEHERAFATLARALNGFRESPWQVKWVMAHSLLLAMEMAANNFHGPELYALLETPFSVYQLEDYRKFALVKIGESIDCSHVSRALGQLEPAVPWEESLLALRFKCYESAGSPLMEVAASELAEFRAAKRRDFFDR